MVKLNLAWYWPGPRARVLLTCDNCALELPMSAQRIEIGTNNACNDGYAFHVLQHINAQKRAHLQTGIHMYNIIMCSHKYQNY